jgi:hypothetical protein
LTVFLTNRSVVREISAKAAAKFDLPQDWLNEGVKIYAPRKGNPNPRLSPFGEYPKNGKTGIGLRVLLPTPEYMLAMKLLSYRMDEDINKIQTDLADAVALMRLTGKTTPESLINLLKLCYPSCQSSRKRDPGFASNRDPSLGQPVG